MTDADLDECWACGKPYAAHADEPDPRATPRMPCVGLKRYFAPSTRAGRVVPAAVGCSTCKTYRDALRAIATGAATGVKAEALGDLARIALLEPEIEVEKRRTR